MRSFVIALVLVLAGFAAGSWMNSREVSSTSSVQREQVFSATDNDVSAQQQVVAAGGSIKDIAGPTPSRELKVEDGESILEAVRAAEPGTVIRVMPGTYHETIYIDKDDIRLIGEIVEGRRPLLDGRKQLNDAVLYSGNNFVIENFEIRDYKGNGIMGQAGNNYVIRNNVVVDTGIYGIFPQLGTNGVVEHNVVSGIADAAIYVGMSDNTHVAFNEVFDSVAGIEIENSRHAIVEYNNVHDNTGGVLAFITPGLPIKTTYDVIIRHNFVIDNNTANWGAPGSTVSGIPAGTGILIMAADDVVIEGNVIKNNKTAGILVTDHANASSITADPESDPNVDRIAILDNVMLNNGYDTITEVKALLLTEFKQAPVDIVRVGVANDGCIVNRQRYRTVGTDAFADCDFMNTEDRLTYLLPPVAPREISMEHRGKMTYLGVCSGCHAYTGQLIGPPMQAIQAIYAGNPQGIADYIEAPVKREGDYPEMPPQDYLDPATRLAVANYVLGELGTATE